MSGRPGGERPGMGAAGRQGWVSSGERGSQGPTQMGQNMQGGQMPGMSLDAGQGQTQMKGDQTGIGRGGQQQGGWQGGPPGGTEHGGAGQGSWYKISLRSVGPYTCLLAFFVLITCMIEKGIKLLTHKKRSVDAS